MGIQSMSQKCGNRKVKKRMFLITDGERPTQLEEMQLGTVASLLTQHDIKLNCVTLDFCNNLDEDDEDEKDFDAGSDENETENQAKNRKILVELQSLTDNCVIFPAETAIELYYQMKKKEYQATRKFRGDLQISPDLKIEV